MSRILAFLTVLAAVLIGSPEKHQLVDSARAAQTTCFWVGASSSTNTASNWSSSSGGAGSTCDGGVVPGTDDNVCFDSSDATNATLDAAPTWGSVDFTGTSAACTGGGSVGGYAGTFTHSSSTAITLSCGSTQCILKLGSSGAMTYTRSSATTSSWSFTNTSGTLDITQAGWTFGNVTQNGAAGTVRNLDAFSMTNTATWTSTDGSWNFNGQNSSIGLILANATNTRTITCGAGTMTVTGTLGSVITIANNAQPTISCSTGTIDVVATATGSRIISFGTNTNKSYGTFKAREVVSGSGFLVDFASSGLDTVNLNLENLGAVRWAPGTYTISGGAGAFTVTGLSSTNQSSWITNSTVANQTTFALSGGGSNPISYVSMNRIAVTTGSIACNPCFNAGGNTTGANLSITYPTGGGHGIIGGGL